MPLNSAIKMLPYQQRWIDDKKKLKKANKARQVGFSFASTYEAVEAGLSGVPGNWYYLSTGERQAIEAIETGAMHAQAFKAAVKVVAEDFLWEGERFNALSLHLPTGRKIVGLPANPRTARGSSGNVILDEFAHHRDARDIYKAVFPFTTRGFKLRILSTPNGKQGMFYDVWTHGKGWSRHEVDIYQAVREGLPVNIEELRAGILNDDDWAQEYCCKFVDEAHAWLPYDLLDAAEDDAATMELPEGFAPDGPCYLGVDFGRKHDRTKIQLNEIVGDIAWTRAHLIMHRAPFRDQLSAIDALMPFCQRACVDATGMGLPLAEELQQRWGSRVEGVTFTAAVKESMAALMRRVYEDRKQRIPKNAELRQDLHSVRRMVTSAGNFRFDADRSDAGHADGFWAQALALHAADDSYVTPHLEVVERSEAAELFSHGSVGGFFDDGDGDDDDFMFAGREL